MAVRKTRLVYVTSSKFKEAECNVFLKKCKLDDGLSPGDYLDLTFRKHPVLQTLEVDIDQLVRRSVADAYSHIRVPCIVEYAGLIFEKYRKESYPGGLTKKMWDSLGPQFLEETRAAGTRATARAVVGYCDGKKIHSFVGETHGILSNKPRGRREFYWDTVFIPDTPDGKQGTKTYAEIVADRRKGLRYKMQELSQSARAMRQLIEYLKKQTDCGLWR